MISAKVMMRLATIGLTAEQAEAVASMLSEVEAETKAEAEVFIEKGRAKARERVQRWRERNAGNVTERYETQRNGLREGDARGDVKQNNLEITKEDKKDNSAAKLLSDVSAFKAELGQVLSTERVDAIVDLRRKKKAPITPHAGRLLVKALRECPNIDAAADEMVIRNWTGIKPEWLESRSAAAPPGFRPKDRTIFDAIDDFIERNDHEQSGITIDHDGGSHPPNVHRIASATRR